MIEILDEIIRILIALFLININQFSLNFFVYVCVSQNLTLYA